jgi:sec-independent protein translocase protein TatC
MTAEARPAPPPITSSDDEDGKVLTILEHLTELRNRVIISSVALIVGVLVALWFTTYAIEFLIEPARQQVPGFRLHQFQLLDYWSTYFRVALLLGLAMAMPVIMYQVLAFVGPGLTKQERRWLYAIVLGCSAMFIVGMAFAYYIVLGPALDFLVVDTDDVASTIGVRAYIDTVSRLLLMMGLVFQLPFVIMGLAKIGVVTSRKLIGWWRYAVVGAVFAAAVITPSIDPVTQAIVTVPILLLYAIGIVLAHLVEGSSFIASRRYDFDAS